MQRSWTESSSGDLIRLMTQPEVNGRWYTLFYVKANLTQLFSKHPELNCFRDEMRMNWFHHSSTSTPAYSPSGFAPFVELEVELASLSFRRQNDPVLLSRSPSNLQSSDVNCTKAYCTFLTRMLVEREKNRWVCARFRVNL